MLSSNVRWLLIITFVIAFGVFTPGSNCYSEELKGIIKIGGTGGAISTMKELASVFMKKNPGVAFSFISHLGTRGGIKAVQEGAIDIGLSGRALTPAERASGLLDIEYAWSPFVFVTAQKNSSLNLNLELIARIYSGDFSQWPDGTRLRLILRPEGDVDTQMLNSMSPEIKTSVKKALASAGMTVALTDQDSADVAEKIKGAFATSTLSLIIPEKRNLVVLSLNGVVPSVKAIADGTYPYFKKFHMVTRPKPSSAVRGFTAFVKSPAGRAVLVRTGNYVPTVK